MKGTTVLLILGILWIFTQPGAALNFTDALQVAGTLAVIALIMGVVAGVAILIQTTVQDYVGEWMLKRRRQRTGRSL